MPDLFVYGTLLIPAVWTRVTGRPLPPGRDAVLPRHRRRTVQGQCYPGMVPDPREDVAGRLYLGVEQATLVKLDAYEGSSYRRVRLAVLVAGRKRPAETWLFVPGAGGRLGPQPWSPDLVRDLDALCGPAPAAPTPPPGPGPVPDTMRTAKLGG